MSDLRITLPRRADISAMDKILASINLEYGKRGHKRAIFDFRNCSYIVPSAGAVLIAYRDYLNERGIETVAALPDRGRLHKFLVSLGVMQPSEGDLTDAYVRTMSQYAVKLTACRSVDDCMQVQGQIMTHVKDRVQTDDDTLASLDYMIGEIWDNAGCHGYGCYEEMTYPKPVYISAFSYRTHVEVAILDRGQGIHTSLRQNNPEYRDASAKRALTDALKIDVSGHPTRSPGFGLYAASEFVRANNGALHIWSSKRRLELKNGRVSVRRSTYEQGTLVTFIIDTQQPIPFERIVSTQETQDYLDIFIREQTGD